MAQAATEMDSGLSQTLRGLAASTVVLTADGALPVEHLGAGDRIITRSGLRLVRRVSVQAMRRAAMVRIGVDTLGVGRPDASVLVAPGQGILIRDWRAMALFGMALAMIPAMRLVDGELIRTEAASDVRLYGLHFDRDEVIYAGGLEIGCTPETVTA